MINQYELLIFDWDGTLMDSEAHIVSAMQASMQELGVEVLDPVQVRDIIGLGLSEAIRALYPNGDEAFIECFCRSYREHWYRESQTADLFPGVRESLALLSDEGYRLAVATGKARRGLDHALKQTGLEGQFDTTRCADETESKPSPRMVQEILAELDVRPERAVMIGDSIYDLQMAHRAGVVPVAVSYGVHSWERLHAERPQSCLDHISELNDWLSEAGIDVSHSEAV